MGGEDDCISVTTLKEEDVISIAAKKVCARLTVTGVRRLEAAR